MVTYRLVLSFDDGTSEEVEEDRYYDTLKTLEEARQEADNLLETTPALVEVIIQEVEVVHHVREVETIYPLRQVFG